MLAVKAVLAGLGFAPRGALTKVEGTSTVTSDELSAAAAPGEVSAGLVGSGQADFAA